MSYFDDSESLSWHRQKWEKMHRRGPIFFVFLMGALGFGALQLVVVCLWDVFVEHEQMDAFALAFYALTSFLDGLFWGAVIWYVSERRYARAKKEEGSGVGSGRSRG